MKGVLDQLWAGNLDEAINGSDDAATYLLASLSAALREDELSELQREHLASALDAMAYAAPGKARMRAAKEHLLLGRRPGRVAPCVTEKSEFRRALMLFMRFGDVSGSDLDRACEALATELNLGRRGGDTPDFRAMKKGFRKYREEFLRQWPDQPSAKL